MLFAFIVIENVINIIDNIVENITRPCDICNLLDFLKISMIKIDGVIWRKTIINANVFMVFIIIVNFR